MAETANSTTWQWRPSTGSVDWLRVGGLCGIFLDGMTTRYVFATDGYRELNPVLADLWAIPSRSSHCLLSVFSLSGLDRDPSTGVAVDGNLGDSARRDGCVRRAQQSHVVRVRFAVEYRVAGSRRWPAARNVHHSRCSDLRAGFGVGSCTPPSPSCAMASGRPCCVFRRSQLSGVSLG